MVKGANKMSSFIARDNQEAGARSGMGKALAKRKNQTEALKYTVQGKHGPMSKAPKVGIVDKVINAFLGPQERVREERKKKDDEYKRDFDNRFNK